jgi:hypothetical protein
LRGFKDIISFEIVAKTVKIIFDFDFIWHRLCPKPGAEFYKNLAIKKVPNETSCLCNKSKPY